MNRCTRFPSRRLPPEGPGADPGRLLPFLPVLLVLTAVRPAAGQAAEDPGAVLDSVAGDTVRVELADSTSPLVGRLLTGAGGAYRLETAGSTRGVEADHLRKLWSRAGHLGGQSAGTGALVGGTVGFVVGFTHLSAFFGVGFDPGVDETSPLAGAVVALPGALVGAGLGYLHGRQQPDWRLRFEAADGRTSAAVEIPLP